jgi:hypothetical protein
MHLFSSDPLILCRRPTAVPPCHKEAATTRLLPGKNDALPSDKGHDTAVVASAAAVRMPLPQVRQAPSRAARGPLRSAAEQSPNDEEQKMAVTLYSGFVPVCVQLLTGLKSVLKKGEDHATAQKWDAATVLNLRFFPDMFPLERQVRQVCNHALGAARVAGVSLPSLPDQDKSFAEIYARIDKVIDCLKGLSPSQIDGKDDAKVTVTIGGQPQELTGQNYLYHFALLQVQFHATTAYDLLRSVGVPIGKIDYLGPRPR